MDRVDYGSLTVRARPDHMKTTYIVKNLLCLPKLLKVWEMLSFWRTSTVLYSTAGVANIFHRIDETFWEGYKKEEIPR